MNHPSNKCKECWCHNTCESCVFEHKNFPCDCKCHQSKEVELKDGSYLVEEAEDTEVEFGKIVNRLAHGFPVDKLDWNERIAPFLREIKDLLDKVQEEAYAQGRIRHCQQTHQFLIDQAKKQGIEDSIKSLPSLSDHHGGVDLDDDEIALCDTCLTLVEVRERLKGLLSKLEK